MPNDWGSDSALGFYSAGLTHSDIVTRLLMYGEGDSGDGAGIDLSYGDVYGNQLTNLVMEKKGPSITVKPYS